MKTTVETYAIEYEDKSGNKTRGIYRYVLEWAAQKEAEKLQAKADAIGRQVIIRAVKTNDRRLINQ